MNSDISFLKKIILLLFICIHVYIYVYAVAPEGQKRESHSLELELNCCEAPIRNIGTKFESSGTTISILNH